MDEKFQRNTFFLGTMKVLICSIKEEMSLSSLIHCLTLTFVQDSIFQTMKSCQK